MQQININNVHVKVQCDNEFRRFVLAEVTYSKLVDTIRTLLRLAANSTVKLCYLDDENDWVLFSTDSELQYAVTLSKSPLKISVALSDEPVVEAALPHPACPFSFPLAVNAEGDGEHPWKWRGGRGGRGCRGGRRGECENKVERLGAKLARLNERHAVLTAKLIESDLPQEKVRAIEWRLSHLQNKIDALKAKQEHIDACATKQEEHSAPVEQTETPKDEEPCERFNHHHFGHHGPRGGWGHGPHGHGFGHHHGHGPHPRWGQRGPHCHRFGALPPSEAHPFGGEHPHPPFPFPHEFAEHPHHGPRGGCKRGEGKGPKFFVHACSIPEGKAAFDRVHAAKEAVMAARRDDKAEKEEIMAKLEELKEAKAAWRAIKVALWKEKKEAQRAADCPRKQAK